MLRFRPGAPGSEAATQERGHLRPLRPRVRASGAVIRVLGSDGGSLWVRTSQTARLCIHHLSGPLRLSSCQGWAGHLLCPFLTRHSVQAAQHIAASLPPTPREWSQLLLDVTHRMGGGGGRWGVAFHFNSNFKIALSTFKIAYPLHAGTSTSWLPVCQLILDSSGTYFYASPQAQNEQAVSSRTVVSWTGTCPRAPEE